MYVGSFFQSNCQALNAVRCLGRRKVNEQIRGAIVIVASGHHFARKSIPARITFDNESYE